MSELETGWLRIKLPQTAGGREAGELGLRPGTSPHSVDRDRQQVWKPQVWLMLVGNTRRGQRELR